MPLTPSDLLLESGDRVLLESNDALLLEHTQVGEESVERDSLSFWIGRSLSMEVIGTADRAKGKTVTIDNNKSGSAGLTLRLDHPLIEHLTPWYNCLIVQYGKTDWVWSGPISRVVYDLGAGTATVSALGWFEVLLPRLLQEEIPFTSIDAALITRALLDLANEQHQTGITPGTYDLTQARTRTFARDASIGQEIQELAELESGFDWYIDPRTRKFDIVERRGEPRPEVKWFYIHNGQKGHGNCRNVQVTVDGNTVVNDIKPRGSSGQVGFAEDTTSRDTYGLRQEAPSLSDVPDPLILTAYANAEIVYRKDPKVSYDIFPKPSFVEGVPEIFTDFDIGDTTYMTARRDNFSVTDQAVRVFGVTITANDDGSHVLDRVATLAE